MGDIVGYAISVTLTHTPQIVRKEEEYDREEGFERRETLLREIANLRAQLNAHYDSEETVLPNEVSKPITGLSDHNTHGWASVVIG